MVCRTRGSRAPGRGAGDCAWSAMPSASRAARRSQSTPRARCRVVRLGAALGASDWAAFRAPRLVHGLSPALGGSEASRIWRSSRRFRCVADARAVASKSISRLSASASRLEILYAFQQLWLDGGYAWVSTRQLQWLRRRGRARRRAVAAGRASDVVERQIVAVLYRQLRAPVERLLADPERELSMGRVATGDAAPGRRSARRIDYSAITQPWLREAGQAVEPAAAGFAQRGHVARDVHVATALSAVLRLRGDRGDEPGALGRQDVVDFLVHLRHACNLRARSPTRVSANCVSARAGDAARRARAGAAPPGRAACRARGRVRVL